MIKNNLISLTPWTKWWQIKESPKAAQNSFHLLISPMLMKMFFLKNIFFLTFKRKSYISKPNQAWHKYHTKEAYLQLKKRWDVVSSCSWQNTHNICRLSWITKLLTKFSFVGTLSNITCQDKTNIFIGTHLTQIFLKRE